MILSCVKCEGGKTVPLGWNVDAVRAVRFMLCKGVYVAFSWATQRANYIVVASASLSFSRNGENGPWEHQPYYPSYTSHHTP